MVANDYIQLDTVLLAWFDEHLLESIESDIVDKLATINDITKMKDRLDVILNEIWEENL